MTGVGNIGEIDELRAALVLIYHRDNGLNGIRSVGMENEYHSHGLGLDEIRNLSPHDLPLLADQCGFSKSLHKADILINNTGISLKSNRGSRPALLNHTHRDGMIKVCQRIGADISQLDHLVSSYWVDRIEGNHNEDVKFINSAFRSNKELMVQILSYFMFRGTAMKDSDYPAELVWVLNDPMDYQSWVNLTPNQVASQIIDHTVISMRGKGMPKAYTDTSTINAHKNIRPWVKNINDSYKGSIHIRF